ncbi:MAG: hypothetical protein J6S49_06860 [Erysipelotrichaceae bacterium]|nr:hypothetical protein [Erysipelotrichaceae bacterium]
MYWLIEETLKECSKEDCLQSDKQYVALMMPDQWQKERDDFDMGIDLDFEIEDIHATMAEVNYDSITGSFVIPNHEGKSIRQKKFAFALDEKGIVFIDSENTVCEYIDRIIKTRKWRTPNLERFIYDFLEELIRGDLTLLEKYEKSLETEDNMINNKEPVDLNRINRIRDHLRILKTHYDRLIDLSQELEENENDFFDYENIRFFTLFSKRVGRLFEMANSLVDYTSQIRDDYEAGIADKQNHIMTLLTVVTSIFMPLTLIAGWYGMNFKYMPELNSVYAYPIIIIISILIALVSVLFFKRQKWL